MEACTLELYTKNIFRITGLPVDATPKEIARQAQKLQMLEEMGGQADAVPAAFSLPTAPSSDEIRAALSRMKEPQHRLVDEFFWFWPEPFGDGKNDPAIQAMISGQAETAMRTWRQREKQGSEVAKHNMAIMYHMYAVDWSLYHATYDLEPSVEEDVKGYWRKAFDRWEGLVDSETIRELLKERILSIDDEALPPGFARRLLIELPQALDKVNAEAALKLAERDRMDWARFHVDFMRETHQGSDDVEATAAMVLGPTRKRVEQRVRAASEQTADKPAEGPRLAGELMAHCRPLLALFELFHGRDGHRKTELFDEVARTVLDMVVSYQKETNDNSTFVELLLQAKTFATSPQILERIDRNISIGESNLALGEMDLLLDLFEKIHKSGESPAEKLRRLQAEVVPLVPALATRFGGEGAAYARLMDGVANMLRELAIGANNTHKDFITAERAIVLARKFAVSPEFQSRIDQDVSALRNNKEHSLCYFCGTAQAANDSVFKFAMHQETFRLLGTVRYTTSSVPIPRCGGCQRKQDESDNTGCIAWALCIVAGAVICGMTGDEINWIAGAIAGAVAGWPVSAIVGLFSPARSLKRPKKHPEVQRLLRLGWAIGEKPPK